MKLQKSIRLGTFLSLILLLIVGTIAPGIARAAPLPAAPSVPNTFDCTAISSIPIVECQALVALFTSTSGSMWTNTTGWLTSSSPCSWFGVTCTTDHVTTLNLAFNNLSGPLPPEIGNLTSLTSLILRSNQLSGGLPSQLGALSHLEILYLATNQLTGVIPPELGNLSSLKYLILQENQLSGSVPPELGKLSNLGCLSVQNNQLSGALPAELAALPKLVAADFSKNKFSGDIPVGFGTLASLTSLVLSYNQFTIPGEPLFSQLNAKTPNDPNWAANQTGNNPPPPPFDCGSISAIPLSECQALVTFFNSTHGHDWTNSSGWLANNTPCTWFGLTCENGHVTKIKLYNNMLKGTIPAEVGNFSALTQFNVPNNQLSGPLPPEIGKLSNLQILYFAANQISGPIPAEIGNLANLQYFVAWQNQLSGPIPPELGKLSKLGNLALESNQLSGAIPVELGNLTSLQIMDLSTNQFCGDIPAGLGTITSLTDLRLSGNHFNLPGEPLISQLYARTPNDRSWTVNQTPGTCGNGSTLLSLYVLAYDNDPASTGNLSAYFPETVASIASATANRTGVRAIILSDLSGPDNVAVYEASNGIVTQVTDNLPTLTESTVVNGDELGGFLVWARTTYPADRTTLSYLGHNKPLPQAGLETLSSANMSLGIQALNLFPLPIHDGAHADYTDNTPLPASLSVYDFSEALRLGSQDGTQPFDVVDISSCFSMSFEEMYALRNYTLTAVGSPNYAFFEPSLAGNSLKAINTGMTAAQMATALVTIKDSLLPDSGHPRILVALDMNKLDALKQAWDSVSYNLWQGLNDPQQRQSFKENLAKAYNYSHKYDCTFCQPQDWALETPDALVDLGSFATMLSYMFGQTSPVGIAAGDVNGYLNQTVITRTVRNGVPWFGNPAKSWDFTGNAGLSLYADLIGQSDDQGHIVLSDIAAWYTRVVSANNPHPYEFVQDSAYGKEVQPGGINWSDVFTSYWQDSTNLLTRLCLPTFPPVAETGDLIAGAVISPITGAAHVGTPMTLTARVTSTTEVHNVQVSIIVYQNQKQVFTDLVNVPIILAGEQITVRASQTWTPTETGIYYLRFFFDSDNHVQETNETNNLVYFTDTVSGSAVCPQPEITVQTLNHQQWWTANTIPLTIDQVAQTASTDAARVNTLVIDFYQFHDGQNPNNQVPVRIDQQTMAHVSLPQGALAIPLSTAIKPGMVVMHIWPRSECGGLGIPQEVTFDYLPNNATLSQNQSQYFTFDVAAGQKVDLTMNVTSGSTRMYVWLPGNSWSAQSINDGGTLTIDPTLAGRYLVSVVGVTENTVYTLTAVLNGLSLLGLQPAGSNPANPVVTVIRARPDFTDPAFLAPGQNRIFLPMLIR